MKTMCPPSYHHIGFVVTHALGQHDNRPYVPKCMSYHKSIVVITGRAHCFHDCIHIYILRSSCFCEIWALCVLWITYDCGDPKWNLTLNKRWNWSSCTKLVLSVSWTHGQSVKAPERNSVVVGSSPTLANFL